jgi:hypothetical protein
MPLPTATTWLRKTIVVSVSLLTDYDMSESIVVIGASAARAAASERAAARMG